MKKQPLSKFLPYLTQSALPREITPTWQPVPFVFTEHFCAGPKVTHRQVAWELQHAPALVFQLMEVIKTKLVTLADLENCAGAKIRSSHMNKKLKSRLKVA